MSALIAIFLGIGLDMVRGGYVAFVGSGFSGKFLQEDGTSFFLLEDGVSFLLGEG